MQGKSVSRRGMFVVGVALEASDVLDLFDFLQVVADVLEVLGVVHTESEFGGKQAVAGVDVYAVDVHVELLREDSRDLMEDAYAVEAHDVECGGEGERAVCVPSGSQDAVPASCFEAFCDVALALVDDDFAVFIEVSEHIIAGNRVTFVAESVSADSLLAEDQRFLLVDFGCLVLFLGLFLCFLLFVGGWKLAFPLE